MPRLRHNVALVTAIACLASGIQSCAELDAPSAPSHRLMGARAQLTDGSGTWTTRASLSPERSHMVAGVIEGKIYIAAGGRGYPDFFKSAAVYSPTTDSWVPVASASIARSFTSTNTAVLDGVLYVVAGNPVGSCTDQVEAYVASTNSWSSRASTPRTRCGAASIAHDGRVWVLGGLNTSSTVRYLEVDAYDPATNTWSTLASMPAWRASFAVAVLNGKLYLVGGALTETAACSNSVATYDFATGTWGTAASMSVDRCSPGVGVMGGRLYALGGTDHLTEVFYQSMESYDPATNTWRAEPAMSTPRTSHSVAVVDNVLYAIGGYNSSQVLTSVEAFTVTPVADVTPPNIATPPDTMALASSPDGAAVTYTATASDNIGVTSFSCTPAPGSVFPIGMTLVACTASDAAGNNASAGFTVTVKGAAAQMADFQGTVEGFNIHEGTETSLLAKLDAAINSFEAGDNSAACGQLDAMINQINAQTGNKISEPEAATLIAQISRIRDVIGC